MLETPGRIEPCFFEEHIPAKLADLSVDIQREAAQLGQGLHPDSAAELAEARVVETATGAATCPKPP